MLAPPPFSRAAVAGVAAVLALTALSVLAGEEVLVAALLVLPPLVVALTGHWGDTLLVAALSLASVLVWPLLEETMQFAISVALVLAGGVVAIAVAVARTGSAVALERFRLLVGAADVADRANGSDELVEGVLDLLVPALGDVAAVDVMLGGERRRIGARVAEGIDPEVRGAMVRRRPLHGQGPSSETAIAADEAKLARPDGRLVDVAASSPRDAELLRGLAIRTALIVPLRARGRVIGAMTTGCGPSGRSHSEPDLRFAEVLAGRVALALDNAGLTRELSAVEEERGVMIDALAEAVAVNAADGSIVYVNGAGVRLLRAESAEELLGRPSSEIMDRFAVYDEDGDPIALEDLPSARLLRGEPHAEPLLVRTVLRATGEERWLVHKCSALPGPDGELHRVINVIEDVTTVKRAERGQRLLARASEALAASMDPGDALQDLVETLVPGFAGWAAIDLPERGRVARAAAAGREPAGELPDGAAIAVPVRAGAQALGTLHVVTPDPHPRYGPDDRALAEELGRRAGVALLNARIYERRSAIAQALQHGLLPPALPDVPGWPAAVSYLPAGELSEVGGDFYDVFRGPDGWMLIVGDMVGQGPEAATMSSLARYTLRAAAELTGDPARAVAHLNAVLRGQPGVPLCTVVCARIDERPGGVARLSLASAGHPLPMVVRGAEVTAVGEPGTIAGAFDGGEWSASDVELRRGDVLVLYTDGVLDAVGADDRFGEARLRTALADGGGPVEERVTGLEARLEAFRSGERRDDLTVLMLEYRGAPELSEQPPAAVPPRR